MFLLHMVFAIDNRTWILQENHVLSMHELTWKENGFFSHDKLEMGFDISLCMLKITQSMLLKCNHNMLATSTAFNYLVS